jgi:hypothetical protein
LIQVIVISRVPRIDAAHPENPVSILIHEVQEPVFTCRRRIQFRFYE